MCSEDEARRAIVSVLDWIDEQGRSPDWWEIANLRDAIKFLRLGSTGLAIRLAEYARVAQGDRLTQAGTGTAETTRTLREQLNQTST